MPAELALNLVIPGGFMLFPKFESSIEASGAFSRECEADPESMVLGQGW
ncbi:MAG: hypothetical protein KKD44_11475 [Proteobacteria bacterium]|nr:hypothetical protein [Pseudomonadota bacterium]